MWPCVAAWRKWNITLVSASSCWRGDKAVMSVALLLSTMSAFVVRRWYVDSTVLLWNSWPMNWNSSSLFWLSLKNFCHSTPLGIGVLAETRVRRLEVSPRLARVCDLRLASWYVSQIASTLDVWQQLHLRVLPKYSGALGFDDVYDCGHIKNNHCSFFYCFRATRSPGRQPIISYLVPWRGFPRSDKDDGSRWFSCLKNASISASGHACKDKNNLMTRAAFALADPSLSAPFLRSAGGLFENVYRLGFCITSDKGLEDSSNLSVTNSVNIVCRWLEHSWDNQW